MENVPRPKTTRIRTVKRVFRKRWIQVGLVLLVWLLTGSLLYARLAPKPVVRGEKGDTSKFKFLHCDQCNMELPYNKDLDSRPCPKCPPPKSGFYVPTETSAKSGKAALPPWTKVYVALFTDTVLMLGAVTYLMYRKVPDPNSVFFIVACPYCNQRLRYRAVSHGGLGSCSRCKRMIRFPDEDDAVTEAEVYAADEASARAEAELARAEAEAEAEAQRDGPAH
ncbi:hypothetical protein [Frigoriglobus tundricola]|uniref:Uncharacterized protein n=1 Tax=Frigoriglobus tundricola TaxID=2774151 RepID=A0A6M5YZ93_9BACT|nr:hypothetical protein [Frigoriglobus tundricola]QJW99275.1 hypothetical protein FTUN_6877 [Frigoriglobus tundricola]